MMTTTDFVERARQCGSDEDAKQALVAELKTWLHSHGRAPSTVEKKDIPPYKKALLDAGLIRSTYFKDYGDTWLKYLAGEWTAQYNQAYKLKTVDHIKGGQYPLTNVPELLTIALRLVQHGNAYEQVLGMSCLTGRREAELGLTARFLPYDGDPVHVDFTGQLKAGEAGRKRVRRIPVLVNRSAVCDALTTLRDRKKEWAAYDPKQFDKSVGPDVRKAYRTHFASLIPNCDRKDGAHTLRCVYAAVAEMWIDHPGYSARGYIASIMGHAESDDVSARSYEYFYLPEDARFHVRTVLNDYIQTR